MADERDPPRTISVTNQAMAGVTASVSMRFRMGFAVQHLLAAARFSRHVGRIEQENANTPFGPFFEEIIGYSCACVFSSVAALEAYANEVFADRAQNFLRTHPTIADTLWDLSESEPVLNKFDVIAALLEVAKADRGSRPTQDVAAIIRLRNAITHFKPEWDDEEASHATLSDLLANRFDGTPFLNPNERMFPRRWMSHAGTRWAVESCLSFLTEFEARTTLKPKVQGFASQVIG